ncbi:MAG: MAPEG family protein [Pseudomonadota bacterium]
MSPELYWLAATALMTAVLWVPYILVVLAEMGPVTALTQRIGDAPPKAAWAARSQHAHRNAVENLVVFAPLALGVHLAGVGTETTAFACMAFFSLRAAHYVVYMAGIPVVRTVIFFGGVICQIVLAVTLLSAGTGSVS